LAIDILRLATALEVLFVSAAGIHDWRVRVVLAPSGIPLDDVVERKSVGSAGDGVSQDVVALCSLAADLGLEAAHAKDLVEVTGLHVAKAHALLDNEYVRWRRRRRQERATGDPACNDSWC
jgi:hypothetical protein